MIAALYVEHGGVYYDLPGVEPWGLPERDAREYDGPWPVVAHPPCNLWVNLAHLNYKRWGGEHNRPGNDGGCFRLALEAVRRWGGVLEHPAFSHAWPAHDLPRPEPGRWVTDGSVWVCEVWQSAYGHRARKRTWLACFGISHPPLLDWGRSPGSHQCGWFDRIKPTLSKREASATPEPFRDLLITMARQCRA